MTGGERPDISPSAALGDDLVLPYSTDKSGVKGRIVRLGPVVDTILTRHNYPDAVSEALGQALALTVMLGSPLKPGGRLSLQTKTDGPIRFLLADYEAPGRLRGYASFDADYFAELSGRSPAPNQGQLIGNGHLALTLERGPGEERYQGVVALEGQSLTASAHTYFRQSEQLPSYVRLAVARVRQAGSAGWQWRAGGLMAQHLSASLDDDGAETARAADEDWQRARILAATTEDHELIDPQLAPERLLFRLFHEENVRVFKPQRVEVHCRCSRERVQMFLTQFKPEDLDDLRTPDGRLQVTCEFCNTAYDFDPENIGKPH
jgi:molecular chaperone Hsp33